MTSSAGEGAAPGFPSAVVNRGLGCLLGLAVGDALGTTLEFRGRDECPALTDMVGGGVFGLAPGERQIAGALWGRSRIPDAWLHRLAWRREIEDRARALLARPG